MEAAFFDLDKTVIARPSMVAFGGHLRREGLVSRRLLLRALWAQLIYLMLGADEARLARVRDAALRVSTGWEQRRITALVRETLTEVVDPIVFDEALDLMRMHRAEGRKVFIVSASPEEIVAPLAQYLGADEAIATRAVLDDEGRYTGDVELYCYGPEKARILQEVAVRDGIDLARSYAYSDSATDVPMLSAVGHAVAVNPDRELARVAREAGWEIVSFSHRVPLARTGLDPVEDIDRRGHGRGGVGRRRRHRLLGLAGSPTHPGAVVVGPAAVGPGREPPRDGRVPADGHSLDQGGFAQTWRAFLAATPARTMRATMRTSFFMPAA